MNVCKVASRIRLQKIYNVLIANMIKAVTFAKKTERCNSLSASPNGQTDIRRGCIKRCLVMRLPILCNDVTDTL